MSLLRFCVFRRKIETYSNRKFLFTAVNKLVYYYYYYYYYYYHRPSSTVGLSMTFSQGI
jgi:hypothetical protein